MIIHHYHIFSQPTLEVLSRNLGCYSTLGGAPGVLLQPYVLQRRTARQLASTRPLCRDINEYKNHYLQGHGETPRETKELPRLSRILDMQAACLATALTC